MIFDSVLVAVMMIVPPITLLIVGLAIGLMYNKNKIGLPIAFSGVAYLIILQIGWVSPLEQEYKQTIENEKNTIQAMNCNQLSDYIISHVRNYNYTYNHEIKPYADSILEIRCHK